MSWKNELQPTADCIAIERLGEDLSAQEREHLSGCPRCQAEMALFNEFNSNETRPEEAEDVKWIVNKLHSSGSNVVEISAWKKMFHPRNLAIAATFVLVIALGYFVQNREPSVDVSLTTGANAYRSARVQVITPKGDVVTAPSELKWEAVSGATTYDVEVAEVDRTTLWHTTTSSTYVELPAAVIAQCVPGKTIVWQVSARRDGTLLAESGPQRFRVKAR